MIAVTFLLIHTIFWLWWKKFWKEFWEILTKNFEGDILRDGISHTIVSSASISGIINQRSNDDALQNTIAAGDHICQDNDADTDDYDVADDVDDADADDDDDDNVHRLSEQVRRTRE